MDVLVIAVIVIGPALVCAELYGMKAAFDEIMATAIKRQHEPQRIVGDLLTAEISEKQARSIKYQLTIAKLPLATMVTTMPPLRAAASALRAARMIPPRCSSKSCSSSCKDKDKGKAANPLRPKAIDPDQ